MDAEKHVLERLAFLKYIYKVGIEQSGRQHPLSGASLLLFHDAIELYLRLSSEYLDIKFGKQDPNFIEYWNLLAEKIGKGYPTLRTSMIRLNKARVELKHRGTIPSARDIEEYKAITTKFFEENTLEIFRLSFCEISLIHLVTNNAVKNNLLEAKELIKHDKIKESLNSIAIAFEKLIDDYENRKKGQYGRSPFYFGKSMNSFRYLLNGIDNQEFDFKRDLVRFMDDVKDSLESLKKAVKMLSLGLDYRRFVKFNLLTPKVLKTADGSYHIVERIWGKRGLPSVNEVEFCIDFVVESALQLQEFDFDIPDERIKIDPALFI